MMPYYQDDAITLYHGDALDVLPTLDAVDHCITDPPYAEETHAGARSARAVETAMLGAEPWGSVTSEDLRRVFADIGQLLRRWLVATVDWRHMVALEKEPPSGLRFVRAGIWVKPDGAPQFTGDRPATGWEAVAILHRVGGSMRWNGGGSRAVWTENRAQNVAHPCEKPQALIRRWVALFTDPGETILDPFLGSGTTARACKDLGRRCIGIELNEKYLEIAARRMAQSVMDMEAAG